MNLKQDNRGSTQTHDSQNRSSRTRGSYSSVLIPPCPKLAPTVPIMQLRISWESEIFRNEGWLVLPAAADTDPSPPALTCGPPRRVPVWSKSFFCPSKARKENLYSLFCDSLKHEGLIFLSLVLLKKQIFSRSTQESGLDSF